MEYQTIHKKESFGKFNFGLEIKVAIEGPQPDLKKKAIRYAVYDAEKLLEKEILAEIKANDPKLNDEIAENKKLLESFQGAIFVEEIPNGYCSDWCCRHLPWFVVTTNIGRFKIGWRKRVIEIDWSETVGTKSGEELFSKESVTVGEKYIHAWNMEDARSYIVEILRSSL